MLVNISDNYNDNADKEQRLTSLQTLKEPSELNNDLLFIPPTPTPFPTGLLPPNA